MVMFAMPIKAIGTVVLRVSVLFDLLVELIRVRNPASRRNGIACRAGQGAIDGSAAVAAANAEAWACTAAATIAVGDRV
jgi:hypothetical protein